MKLIVCCSLTPVLELYDFASGFVCVSYKFD